MAKLTNVFRIRPPRPPAPPTRPSELRYRVETDTTATTIYLAGSLDDGDTTQLRDVLRGCLADTPSVIIIDLTGLSVLDQAALSAFGSGIEDGWWPGNELLLAGAREQTHPSHTQRGRSPRCFATRDEACAAAAANTDPQRFSEHLHPRPDAGKKTHQLITDACATWQLEALVGPVHIAGAELVANAVRHTGTDLVLTLALRPRTLHIAVRDGSHDPPRIYGPHHPQAHPPQGLLRLDSATDDWGVTELTDGKLVWASWDIQEYRIASRNSRTCRSLTNLNEA